MDKSKIVKIEDISKELLNVLEKEGFDPSYHKLKMDIKPRGSTYKIDGRTFILVPSEGYDVEGLIYFNNKINLKKRAGWDVLGGPTVEMCEKIDADKPAWLIYEEFGVSYYVYEF